MALSIRKGYILWIIVLRALVETVITVAVEDDAVQISNKMSVQMCVSRTRYILKMGGGLPSNPQAS